MTELLYFSAAWCTPCKVQWPTTKFVADKLSLPITKVELDADTAAKWEVQSIPTLVVVRDGTEVCRHVGAISRERLTEALQARI